MIKIIALLALLLCVAFSLSSCSRMQVKDYANQQPRFIPEEFFLGKTSGVGQFWDRFNNLRLDFVVDLDGSWDGKVLTLVEVLKYSSGEVFNRTYKITKISENLYSVDSEDLDGTGTIESQGNALKWTYYLKQKIGDRIVTLHFDDWMFLRENNLVINRAFGKKWGFSVGEVIMSINKNVKSDSES